MPRVGRTAKPFLLLLSAFVLGLGTGFLLPESPHIPVQNASAKDWNRKSFWYEPWGVSGVHKGIDIFAALGTPVVAPTYGLVVYQGDIPMGGNVVVLLGPKWRLHYFAHLATTAVAKADWVKAGQVLGAVGDSGNAKGKPPHLHYAVLTALPYPWRADRSSQGWKKMFYLDPNEVLGVN